MRLDKFLKVSRLIKRRTIAKEISDNGRVFVNDKLAKPSLEVKVGDVITLNLNSRLIKARILELKDYVKQEEASQMYEIIE